MSTHSDKLSSVRAIVVDLSEQAERSAYDLRVQTMMASRDGLSESMAMRYRVRAEQVARTHRLLRSLVGVMEGRKGSAVYVESLRSLQEEVSDSSPA